MLLPILALLFVDAPVRQGSFLRVEANPPAATARMNETTIRLYPQTDGRMLGLMPVGVNTKIGSYTLEVMDDSQKVLQKRTFDVENAHFATQNIVISKERSTLHSSEEESETVQKFWKTTSPERSWTDRFALPTPGCMNSPFGVRRAHNGKLTGDYHGGVDQRGAQGTLVRAPAPGVVKIARQFQLRGGTVAIDHGQGVQSMYFHLSAFTVPEGTVVKAGDVIAKIGSTGRANGPHLHWSLYASGVPINPQEWTGLKPCARSAPARPAKKKQKH